MHVFRLLTCVLVVVLCGCQVGARRGVFEPEPAPLPPSFEGFSAPAAQAAAPPQNSSSLGSQ